MFDFFESLLRWFGLAPTDPTLVTASDDSPNDETSTPAGPAANFLGIMEPDG